MPDFKVGDKVRRINNASVAAIVTAVGKSNVLVDRDGIEDRWAKSLCMVVPPLPITSDAIRDAISRHFAPLCEKPKMIPVTDNDGAERLVEVAAEPQVIRKTVWIAHNNGRWWINEFQGISENDFAVTLLSRDGGKTWELDEQEIVRAMFKEVAESGADCKLIKDGDNIIAINSIRRTSMYKELAAKDAEIARLKQERSDALNVKSKDGLLSSEWLARTGKAERERNEALTRLAAAEKVVDSFRCADHYGLHSTNADGGRYLAKAREQLAAFDAAKEAT